MPLQSRRIQDVQSPIIPVVGELIRTNPGTISLGQGVVSYGPPARAIERIAQFLADPENHKYKSVHGIAPLLDALIAKLESENGVRFGSDRRLVVTAGGNMAFMNAVLAVTNPADEVILLTPYYFNHEMAVTMAGCRPVLVETDANHQPRPDAIAAAITPRTRAVVTISPNNPTGAVYPESTLRAVNALCRERGIFHVHDEAYEYFTYDGATHFSPAAIDDPGGHTVTLHSLSKAYGFASWRIGYMTIPAHLFDAVRKIQDTILICPPVVSQYAAVGALEAGASWCREKLRGIADVRRTVLRSLDQLGDLCTIPPAPGAFYFLLRVNTKLDAMTLVERMIREHRVAVIPGTTFGMHDGCYLRVAYGALRQETAEEGIGRFVRGMKAILRP